MGATSRDVEAAGARVDFFPDARGVLTFGPLDAALPGGGSLRGAAALSVSGRTPLGFLSGIGKGQELIKLY